MIVQAQLQADTGLYPRLVNFVIEREAIRLKKEGGKRPPWTHDEILRDGYFCNVRREDDKVTRWIAKHWRVSLTRAILICGSP
jgi:hypothetical protein